MTFVQIFAMVYMSFLGLLGIALTLYIVLQLFTGFEFGNTVQLWWKRKFGDSNV